MKRIAAALMMALPGWALTAPALADEAYDKCVDAQTTNTAWAACGWAWVEREDKRLNLAWKGAYASLPPKAKVALLAEQRAWLAYRDKSCLWPATGEYGREGQVLDAPRCRAEMIALRVNYLDELGERGE